ncbi:MAG: alpha/beta hydrolase [Gemmatimonadales bacterium]|nr:MAG: alpha/beta hydrolase [Gemmatimonadales bacterium]
MATRALRWTGFLLILGAFLYLLISPRVAERLVFLPDVSHPGSPPALAGVSGEEVWLEASDGVRVRGWWWEVNSKAPAVLFFHGNAGHLGHRVFTARELVERGLSVFVLGYRGYGGAEGIPTEAGVLRDGEAALRWVVARSGGEDRVVLHGRSLGGFVALGVASRSDPAPAGVVVESSFTSLEEMARVVYPFLPRFLFRRLRGHFDNEAAARSLASPMLVIHGTADDMIPTGMGARLVEAAGGRAEWLQVEGAGHNDLPLVGGEEYWDRVAAFAREVTAR